MFSILNSIVEKGCMVKYQNKITLLNSLPFVCLEITTVAEDILHSVVRLVFCSQFNVFLIKIRIYFSKRSYFYAESNYHITNPQDFDLKEK